ncbi:hypothetical protein GW17_00012623 [Ensete ventricosum]|nr:hypothetical protein GW17_00012623 [Ensete ventricosum]
MSQVVTLGSEVSSTTNLEFDDAVSADPRGRRHRHSRNVISSKILPTPTAAWGPSIHPSHWPHVSNRDAGSSHDSGQEWPVSFRCLYRSIIRYIDVGDTRGLDSYS